MTRDLSPARDSAPGLEDRQYPLRPVIGVGAVVTVAAVDRPRFGLAAHGPTLGIVLVRRRFPPLAGEWSLPGGAVELGETLEAAIAREVVEETGLIVEVGRMVEVFDRIMLDDSRRVQYHFVLVDYVCRAVAGGLTAGSDVSDAVVADPATLESYSLTDKARSIIDGAWQMLRGSEAR